VLLLSSWVTLVLAYGRIQREKRKETIHLNVTIFRTTVHSIQLGQTLTPHFPRGPDAHVTAAVVDPRHSVAIQSAVWRTVPCRSYWHYGPRWEIPIFRSDLAPPWSSTLCRLYIPWSFGYPPRLRHNHRFRQIHRVESSVELHCFITAPRRCIPCSRCISSRNSRQMYLTNGRCQCSNGGIGER
jgi:hypothetical protein